MRLDNTVYRLGLATSRARARQLVSHGHLLVNDRRVNIPSFQVKAGDVIKLKKKSQNQKPFKELAEKLSGQEKLDVPGWLNFNKKELSGKVLHQPTKNDIQTNINTQMIVEFYSK